MKNITVSIDVDDDRIEICGVRYSLGAFNALGNCPPGTWLRIECREDSRLTVRRVSPEMQANFDALIGLSPAQSTPPKENHDGN